MQKTIITHTRKQVRLLLNQRHGLSNVKKLRHARYMRNEYMPGKKRVSMTLTEVEFALVSEQAALCGLTPTAFSREAVFAYLKVSRVPMQNLEKLLSELIFLLRNTTNNLNQIAKQSNTYQRLRTGDFRQLRQLMAELEDNLLKAIKQV